MKPSEIIVVTDATFEREVLAEKRPVLVDFGAQWCPPCKALKPVIEAVARERAGRLKVVEIDMDASPESVRRCAVRAAPTLVVFRDGEKRAVLVGAVPKEKFLALVDRL
ncbi:MAG TPA: thioredoxin domain-containing protein [Polyangiaceae bacterium]|nr:thioredoxin domain-containing protein [Polyangiaceae bacterium]